MSNTSVVTPYEPNESTSDIAESSGNLAAFFADTDVDHAFDRLASDAHAQQVTDDFARCKQLVPLPVVSVNLHLETAASLLRSAPAAGYRIVQELPRPKADFLILQSNHGDRVVIEQFHSGGVRAHALGSRVPINDIVRRQTLDLALNHLQDSGRQVVSKTLPNGEVQVQARSASDSGKGELHVQIRRDGSSVLDVVGTRGPQCMEIVREFAEATGGVIEQTVRKDECFMLPGELRREKVHIK